MKRAQLALLAVLLGACAAEGWEETAEIGSLREELLGWPIYVPPTALERPTRVYVLPVFYVPSDRQNMVPNPDQPGMSLAGTPISGANQTTWTAAKTNFVGHLRVAQEKYRLMLEHPTTGASRGTFAMATWDRGEDLGKLFDPALNTLEPLVFVSSRTNAQVEMAGWQTQVGELLDYVGCEQQSCPYIFAFATVDGDANYPAIGAQALNYGWNGGGGVVKLKYQYLAQAHTALAGSYDNDGSVTLSTLLHELGHAFGHAHLDQIYWPPGVTHEEPCDNGCTISDYQTWCGSLPPERAKYEFYCSESVMSYSKLNWTSGCVATNAQGHCVYPSDPSVIAAVPGILLGEQIRDFAVNQLVFPGLEYIPAVDGGSPDNYHAGPGATAIPGHTTIGASSPTSGAGAPWLTVGMHSHEIPSDWAPWDGERMWQSTEVGEGSWAHIDVDFPEAVLVARVVIFTQYGGGTHPATAFKVSKGNPFGPLTECGSDYTGHAEIETSVGVAGVCAGTKRRYRVSFRAGTSDYVVVRGIRFFDLAGDELFPPVEPKAKSTYGHTGAWASNPSNVVGREQYILPYSAPFDADVQWHSKQVAPGEWVSMDVKFPSEVALQSIAVYTGHSATYHAATEVQVERKGSTGTFVYVDRDPVTYDSLMSLPTTGGAPKAQTWRIAFRTGSSGYVTVRGLQFFTPGGEIFPPRWDGDLL